MWRPPTSRTLPSENYIRRSTSSLPAGSLLIIKRHKPTTSVSTKIVSPLLQVKVTIRSKNLIHKHNHEASQHSSLSIHLGYLLSTSTRHGWFSCDSAYLQSRLLLQQKARMDAQQHAFSTKPKEKKALHGTALRTRSHFERRICVATRSHAMSGLPASLRKRHEKFFSRL